LKRIIALTYELVPKHLLDDAEREAKKEGDEDEQMEEAE
jgi:hypothetical protein